MARFFHILRIGLMVTLPLAPCRTLSADEPYRNFAHRVGIAITAPVVQYCRANAPESAREIDEGYANFMSSMEVASEMWIATLGKGRWPIEIPRSFDVYLEEESRKLLERVKQVDARKYCQQLAATLSAATPESLFKLFQEHAERARKFQRERAQL